MPKQCKIITCKRIEDIALQKWYKTSLYLQCAHCIDDLKSISILKNKLYIHVTEIEYRYQNSDVQTVNYPFINIYIYIYTCMYDSDTCTLCNHDTRGDEYHFVLICPF